MAATYAPGNFTTLIGKSGLRFKPTRTGTYHKAVGYQTLRSLYGLTKAAADGFVTTEGLSSATDNMKQRWIYI